MLSHNLLLGAALFATCSPLLAGEFPLVKRCYASTVSAAIAAIDQALPLSKSSEYAGALYAIENCYSFTAPKSSDGFCSVAVVVQLPRGAQLVGIYHTHPDDGGEQTKLFSPGDVRVARALGLPSYIGVVRDKSLRVLAPGARVEFVGVGARRAAIARGEVVKGVSDIHEHK